jgi:glycyl-tRNA synthetase
LGDTRMFNLMLKTYLGPVDAEEELFRTFQISKEQDHALERNVLQNMLEENRQLLERARVYMRPETAQGIFVNFQNVLTATRRKLPFGIAQIGKSFRNEITPGNFIFRTREFEQMEIEYFVKPGTDEGWFQHWLDERFRWYTSLGMRPENLRLRPHASSELAHYARACQDVEYLFPMGWSELEGIANRGDFDLRAHAEASGKDLTYFDEEAGEHVVPFVIEPSGGVDRTFLAFLIDAYDEEEVRGETRVVLRLHPDIAPVKVAVLPLSRNEALAPTGHEVHDIVRGCWFSQYDDAQSIGRRYRRQDEIGTPLCVTIDFDTLQDRAVTIRDRDSMEQVRVPIADLVPALAERLYAK